MSMAFPQNVSGRTDTLCNQCSKVDFSALFSSEIKSFHLGTLSTIMDNRTCPFCCLIIHAINNNSQFRDILSTSYINDMSIWVKTTFWAHCNYDNMNYGSLPSLSRITQFRLFRPALGTDWMPGSRSGMWDRTTRSSICELDSIPTDQYPGFCTEPEQERPQVLHRRLISDMVDISLIQSWVKECQDNHNHLTQQDESQAQLRSTRQFRVYDVFQSRLIEPTECVEYIALSYVWGNTLRQRQLEEPDSWWSDLFDDDEHTQWEEQGRHVRFDKLPRAVQDASLLLQRLGYRYLWVDLLCVCQDDSLKKGLLIKHMHVVYEAASFTIVAAGGEDADSPLHGLHEGTRSSERTWTIPTVGGDFNLTLARPDLKEIISNTHWRTRGWTFQEEILSSRCLYFTQDEVFYWCSHHSERVENFPLVQNGRFSEWREGYMLETRNTRTTYQSLSPWNKGWLIPSSPALRRDNRVIQQSESEMTATDHTGVEGPWPPIYLNSRSRDPGVFHDYASSVCEYTQRNLTEAGDIINAFMGILGKFGAKVPLSADVRFHGLLNYEDLSNGELYSDSLEKGLLWIPSRGNALRRRRIEPDPTRKAPLQFPSWAWSGWVGMVDYPVQDLSDPSIRRHRLRSNLTFSPATFAPKVKSIGMNKLFEWSRLGSRRIIASIKRFRDNHDNTPKESLDANSSCTLTMFTHVAKVAMLTRQSGFMAQDFQIWADHTFYNICPTVRSESNCTPVFPDSGTLSVENEHKLVCIGKGETEWVVLLLEQKGPCYERKGLTTVSPDMFEWTYQWIDIV